jgi:hypothetical protein
MFNRRLRLPRFPDAGGSDRDTEPGGARKAAIGPGEAIWLALIAAFVALAAAQGAIPSRGLTGSSPGCVFAGKGGVICNRTASAGKIASENADRCFSLGKGGRFCPPAK